MKFLDFGTALLVVAAGAIFAAAPGAASAAATTHTLHAVMVTPPGAPGSEFSVSIQMSPDNDIDIVGYDIRVGYDNTKATVVRVEDNTGQPFAGVEYNLGGEEPLAGISYANVSRYIGCSTLSNLHGDNVTPLTNLALVIFKVVNTPSGALNPFYVHLRKHGNPGGLIDGTFTNVPTEYDSLAPLGSGVSDWQLY